MCTEPTILELGAMNSSTLHGLSIAGRLMGIWFPQKSADTWLRLWIFPNSANYAWRSLAIVGGCLYIPLAF